MRRYRGTFTIRPPAQVLVNGDFITLPFNIDAPNILSSNVRVRFRESPEARPASVRVFGFPPIVAVFTRPRLGALAGCVKKHVFLGLAFIKDRLTSHTIGDSMVNLQKARMAFFASERVSSTIAFCQRSLEGFGECLASADPAANDPVGIAETVSRDLPTRSCADIPGIINSLLGAGMIRGTVHLSRKRVVS